MKISLFEIRGLFAAMIMTSGNSSYAGGQLHNIESLYMEQRIFGAKARDVEYFEVLEDTNDEILSVVNSGNEDIDDVYFSKGPGKFLSFGKNSRRLLLNSLSLSEEPEDVLKEVYKFFSKNYQHQCSAMTPFEKSEAVSPLILLNSYSFGCCTDVNRWMGNVLLELGFDVYNLTSDLHSSIMVTFDTKSWYLDADLKKFYETGFSQLDKDTPPGMFFRKESGINLVECSDEKHEGIVADETSDLCLPKLSIPFQWKIKTSVALKPGDSIKLFNRRTRSYPYLPIDRQQDDSSAANVKEGDFHYRLKSHVVERTTLGHLECQAYDIRGNFVFLSAEFIDLPSNAIVTVIDGEKRLRAKGNRLDLDAFRVGTKTIELNKSLFDDNWGGYSARIYLWEYVFVNEDIGSQFYDLDQNLVDFKIYEDGFQIGTIDEHKAIIERGEGRYSIRNPGNHLVFSSSDKTSPLTNSKKYQVSFTEYRGIYSAWGRTSLKFEICVQDNEIERLDETVLKTKFMWNGNHLSRSYWPDNATN